MKCGQKGLGSVRRRGRAKPYRNQAGFGTSCNAAICVKCPSRQRLVLEASAAMLQADFLPEGPGEACRRSWKSPGLTH